MYSCKIIINQYHLQQGARLCYVVRTKLDIYALSTRPGSIHLLVYHYYSPRAIISPVVNVLTITWFTYTLTTPTKEEILDNHRSVLCSFGISTKDEELDILYRITQVSFQTALYCWVSQMLHETSFQIINMYSIGGQNRASELLRH